MQLPPVLGVTARFYGAAGGSTNYRYWVQAIYPAGLSQLSVAAATGAKALAALTQGNFVNVQWAPAPGAIGYYVYRNTTGTLPVANPIFVASSETGIKDDGSLVTLTQATRYDGVYVAKAYYDFSVDGGAIGAITPVQSDTIPANAIVYFGLMNPTTALTSGGSATISVGTTAGSSGTSLKALTAVASYSIDAIMALVPVGTAATAFKMSAAGQINITVAVAALTTGVLEIFVFYILPTNP